jgi:hypothetical protein
MEMSCAVMAYNFEPHTSSFWRPQVVSLAAGLELSSLPSALEMDAVRPLQDICKRSILGL